MKSQRARMDGKEYSSSEGVSRSQSCSITINPSCTSQSECRSTRDSVLCTLDDCNVCKLVSCEVFCGRDIWKLFPNIEKWRVLLTRLHFEEVARGVFDCKVAKILAVLWRFRRYHSMQFSNSQGSSNDWGAMQLCVQLNLTDLHAISTLFFIGDTRF